ncbi:hypothetical protein RvY_04550 [Ramazzottius varieornatus]|uniref:Major facilitator superfamily (MFS) profile domain-containing protein n=1 Tax=Ramazzottius varieornatus TaxID=947166 RepID=A0A1D1US17_RAMVA|nr:hypothetical protein RvY_04550 [Ramazzottius varieornatus]
MSAPESVALELGPKTDPVKGGNGASPEEKQPVNLQHNEDAKTQHGPDYRRSRTFPGLSNRPSRDQGYAWIILVASCCLYNICDGVSFSMGMFFPYFLETFKESAGKTSWIASIMMANTLLTGPISSYLLYRFGARAVCFFGATLATVGAVISFFATSVFFLMFSLGILTGFGLGCMMLPALVSVTSWFDRRRALAVGASVCAGGLGMFLYSVVMEVLLYEYGLHGAFLVLGGMILNGCVFGLLLHPAPDYFPPLERERKYSVTSQTASRPRFNLRIFRMLYFNMFLASCFLFALGYFPVQIFVTSYVNFDLYLTKTQAAHLFKLISVGNVLGRLIAMVLLDRDSVNKVFAVSISILLAGATVVCSVFCRSYDLMTAFSTSYGLWGGFTFVGLPVVMAEIVGPLQVGVSSGFFVFSLGLAALIGIPGSGYFLEFTEHNYTVLFFVSGGTICVGGLIMATLYVLRTIGRRK